MPRISPVDAESATPEVSKLLTGLKKKLGMVPNLIATMAQSPALANAYLGFSQALAGGGDSGAAPRTNCARGQSIEPLRVLLGGTFCDRKFGRSVG